MEWREEREEISRVSKYEDPFPTWAETTAVEKPFWDSNSWVNTYEMVETL